VLSPSEPDADLAVLASRLGAAYYFAGDMERAAPMVEQSLDVAEALGLPEVLARAWVTKGIICASQRRPEEARGFFLLALEFSDRNALREDASRASGNLSDLAFRRDRYTEALTHLERSASAARMIGSRPHEWFALSESTYALFMLGRWEEAFAAYEELPQDQLVTGGTLLSPLSSILEMRVHRGDVEAARGLLEIYAALETSENVQGRCCYEAAATCLRFSEGRHAEAVEYADRALEGAATLGPDGQDVKMAVIWGIEAALAMSDRAKAEELVEWVEATPPGLRPPSMALHAHRARARLAGSLDEAEPHHIEAVAGFRELELPFWLAVSQVEYAEALIAGGRTAEAEQFMAEARPVFERLEVGPWLERTGRAAEPGAVEAV
jgi:tetratricopeptide (TPR) repeat protein